MELESIKNEFKSRVYHWALLDIQREERQRFPFLHSFKAGLGKRALNILLATPEESRSQFFTALVRRFWMPKSPNDVISDEEKAMVKCYLREINTRSSDEEKLLEMRIREPWRFQLDRKHMAVCLKKELEPIVGSPFRQVEPNVWRATTDFKEYKLFTFFDLGASSHQISYYHALDPAFDYIYDGNISLLAWMGIGSQTDWSGLQEIDVEPTANHLGKICDHFLKAMPVLLDGLNSARQP